MRAVWLLGLLTTSAAIGGCDGELDPYVCSGDESCVRGGETGRCLVAGGGAFCAFPDGECAPSMRWDTSAAPELRDTCVGSVQPTVDSGVPIDRGVIRTPDLSRVPDLTPVDHCMNGVQNTDETDVDCGGAVCPACGLGLRCALDRDCQSGICVDGVCAASRPVVFSVAPANTLTVASGPGWIVANDFNSDGKLDLGLTNQSAKGVSALLGDGAGGFRVPIFTTTPFSGYGLASGDFNLDGSPDLALADNQGARAWVMNNRGGSFTQGANCGILLSPTGVAAADFTGDGIVDLAFFGGVFPNGKVTVVRNTGLSCSAMATYNVGMDLNSITAGDVNGDGRPDLAMTDFGASAVYVLVNTGGGVFTLRGPYSVSSSPDDVVIADVTGDGKPDLIVAVRNANKVAVLAGTNGGFSPAVETFSGALGPDALAVGDIDGDGRADVVAVNSGMDNVSVLLGSGGGALTAPQFFSVGGGPSSLVLSDFNRDGKLDIATANFSGNSVSVLLNTTH